MSNRDYRAAVTLVALLWMIFTLGAYWWLLKTAGGI